MRKPCSHHEVVSVLNLLVGEVELFHGRACLAAARAGGQINTLHHRGQGALEQGEGVFSKACRVLRKGGEGEVEGGYEVVAITSQREAINDVTYDVLFQLSLVFLSGEQNMIGVTVTPVYLIPPPT